ncbi:MAG: CBS domain-containing protein [Thiotrichaceae bacterium]|nr:CBS domain-containing protein [Thiotrichaceae bacterium]
MNKSVIPAPSLLSKDWWKKFINNNPEDQRHPVTTKLQLTDTIRRAHNDGLIANEALGMIEGVMQVDQLQARNVMLTRSQVNFIQRDSNFKDILNQVLDTGHSRYPVIDENKDDIDGILHAKDLLKFLGDEQSFDIDDIIRPPIFASETQRLNKLLSEFKKSRNHMAMIIDEYGGLSGIVTIEDILEQIVGQIDDEHDKTEKPNIQSNGDRLYTVNALTHLTEFNTFFDSQLESGHFDTIGGFVTHLIGKIPHQSEQLFHNDFTFTVLSSDGRCIQLLEVKQLEPLDD